MSERERGIECQPTPQYGFLFDSLVTAALRRRIEARSRDHAQSGVTDGVSLRFLMTSPSTRDVPATHEKFCLLPPRADSVYLDVQSLKVYIPISTESGLSIADTSKLFASVRRPDLVTRRFEITPKGLTEIIRYDHKLMPLSDDDPVIGEELEIMGAIVAVTDPESVAAYALTSQQKKEP